MRPLLMARQRRQQQPPQAQQHHFKVPYPAPQQPDARRQPTAEQARTAQVIRAFNSAKTLERNQKRQEGNIMRRKWAQAKRNANVAQQCNNNNNNSQSATGPDEFKAWTFLMIDRWQEQQHTLHNQQ